MKKILAGIVLGLVLGGGATWLALRQPAAAKPEEKAASLDITAGSAAITKQLAAIGLTTASPETVTLSPEVKGYGRVLDPAPLVALVAEVETARATLGASEKDFDRVQKLHADNANASGQAVETAQAAVQRDRTTLASARARLIASVGLGLADTADLGKMVTALEEGRALARIDVPAGDTPADSPKTIRAGLIAGGEMFDTTVLGPAPTADPQVQGVAFLVLLRDHAAPAGAALRALVPAPGEPQKALVLPRGAFVRHEGGVFVYVQTDQGGFERRLVTLGPALTNGIVVATGVEANDKVVVTGAQQLLATELLGSAGGGDEG
jgi:hypothetical protein